MARHWGFALVALAGAALYAVLTAGDLIGMQDDGVVYLLMARHYAPWLAADPVTPAVVADSAFPPLFPLVLALGGGAGSAAGAHLVVVFCLVLALAAMYAWLLELGLGRAVAAGAVAVFALCPGTVWLMFNVLSEPLYAAFSLAACLVFLRTGRRAASGPYAAALTATALVAAACLTRSAGVTLLPALAVYLWLRHRARGLPLLAVAALPGALWSATHSSSVAYSGLLLDALPYFARDPAGFLAAQGAALLDGLSATLFLASPWVAAPLLLLALAGAAVRAARGHADAIAVFCHFGLVLAWPFPDEAQRLAWPGVPLLIGNLLWTVGGLAQRWPHVAPALMPRLPALLLAGLALAVAPSPALVAERWFSAEAAAQPELRHVGSWYEPRRADARWRAPTDQALAAAFRDLGARIPEGECSLSIMPRLVTYYGGRRSILPPPATSDAAAFLQSLRWRACRYVVMVAVVVSDRAPTAFYPLERLGTGVEILAQYPVVIGGEERPLVLLGRIDPGALGR